MGVRVTVAVLALLLSGANAGQSETAEMIAQKPQAELQKTVQRLNAHVENFLTKALTPAMRTKHSSMRRLADSDQCAWSNGTCTGNDAFLTTLLPSSGPLRDMYSQQTACMAHTTESACVGTCSWKAAHSICEGTVDDAVLQTLSSTMFNTDQCGWLASAFATGASGPCHQRTTAQCTGQCEMRQEWQASASGDSCTQQPSCGDNPNANPPYMMAAMCPGVDFMANQQTCAANLPPCGSSCDHVQRAHDANLCMFDGCPVMQGIMQTAIETSSNCMALTTQADCTGNAACQWEGSNCNSNTNDMSGMLGAVPDACPLKGVMTQSATCSMLSTQSACTGDCEYSSLRECDSRGNIMTSASCMLGEQAAFRAMAATGNADAVALANMEIIMENCHGKAQSECASASADLMTATASVSLGQRAAGQSAALLMAIFLLKASA